jgi:hypothetical protein
MAHKSKEFARNIAKTTQTYVYFFLKCKKKVSAREIRAKHGLCYLFCWEGKYDKFLKMLVNTAAITSVCNDSVLCREKSRSNEIFQPSPEIACSTYCVRFHYLNNITSQS